MSKASWPASVCDEVLRERLHQVNKKGFTPEHDNIHSNGQLAQAAASYIWWGAGGGVPHGTSPATWPWEASWWKPTTPRRDLIKAAALIVAEIERLDRLEQAHG